ncbi:hypothetical protein [Allorhizobium sonneratiae]|uniref:hypothetical protein n=1 Tax=Allorhizobium sonneratiae TaxID=2934936 RepID=UPI0020344CDA|nr:hypothetical protein [Allorhizobium sonneratiae]
MFKTALQGAVFILFCLFFVRLMACCSTVVTHRFSRFFFSVLSMARETVNALVMGVVQAGIAIREHLSRVKIDHLVLERARIAESWCTQR